MSDKNDTIARDEEKSTQHDHVEADLRHADLTNHFAVKGDDSDGAIEWTWKGRIAVVCLAGLYVGAQLPLLFIGSSMAYIAADLKISTGLAWIPVSNTITLASIAPFCGYLQDLLGRRHVLLVGGAFCLVGTIVVGTAHSYAQLIVGMCLEGAGAAVCELGGLAGIAEIVPVSRRGLGLGLCTGFLFPFYPYIMYAELISSNSSWRWTMWICVIYIGVFFVGAALFYWPKSHARAEAMSKLSVLKKIDYAGGILSVAGLTLLLVALNSGGNAHPWRSAYVLCTLLLGIACLIGFVVCEVWFAPFPMIPKELFKGQRVVGLAYLVAFISGMNFYSILNFFPLLFSAVYEPEPVQIGLKGLAYGIALGLGATGFNIALSLFKNHNKYILLGNTIAMTAFVGALAVNSPTNPKLVTALVALSSFVVGGILVPSATVALTAAPDALVATTVALSLSIRVAGGSIGYSIYYNVFSGKLTSRLPEYVGRFAVNAGLDVNSAPEFVTAFLTNTSALATIPGVDQEIISAATMGTRWAYADSLKYVWYTTIGFGVLSIVAAAALPNNRKYLTNRIAAQLH